MNGVPSATGRIGFVSLGISYTSIEFGQFFEMMRTETVPVGGRHDAALRRTDR